MNKSDSFSLEWTIENYSMYNSKMFNFIKSPMFGAEYLGGYECYFRFYPTGNQEVADEHIVCIFSLVNNNNDVKTKTGDFKIEVVGPNGEIFGTQEAKNETVELRNEGLLKIEELNNKMKKLQQDKVTVRFWTSLFTIGKTIKAKTVIGFNQMSLEWRAKCPYFDEWTEECKFNMFDRGQIKFTLTAPEDDILVTVEKESYGLPLCIKCRLTLLDTNDVEKYSATDVHRFGSVCNNDTWNFPIFIKRNLFENEPNLYLKNGVFTLILDLFVSNGIHRQEMENQITDNHSCLHSSLRNSHFGSFQSDLNKELVSKNFADLELRVGGVVFPVHKSILATRSPVFKNMLNPMNEKIHRRVIEVDDVDPEAMRIFIDYIYGGTLHLEEENISLMMKLLTIATKYQNHHLIESIYICVLDQIRDENVCEILDIADSTEQKFLKRVAINYVKNHTETILISSAWMQLKERKKVLAMEVEGLAEKFKLKKI